MIADSRFADALARLPDYLGSHVLVSVTALVLGLAVSLPLALLSIRRPAWRGVLLADRIVVMRAGAVIADGEPRALMGQDTDPYVRELMQTPRRQAERLNALMTGRDATGPAAKGPGA